nr:MAG TPA: hypothetical protein [Bacteriophage sp.]
MCSFVDIIIPLIIVYVNTKFSGFLKYFILLFGANPIIIMI